MARNSRPPAGDRLPAACWCQTRGACDYMPLGGGWRRCWVCGTRWGSGADPGDPEDLDRIAALLAPSRVLVTGSRHWTDVGAVERELLASRPAVVIAGDAPGADRLSVTVARRRGIDVCEHRADWRRHGRRAGVLRNLDMLRLADPSRVLAFHDDLSASRGTRHMCPNRSGGRAARAVGQPLCGRWRRRARAHGDSGLMRAALAARVSTRDKNQDPEVQLAPMREFAAARGWAVTGEYVDLASASDFVRRKVWKRLLDDVRRRRVDLVAVWKLDRAFRSAIECLNTLEDWQARGVHFVCVSQPEIDTTTPIGRLLLTVLAAVAEFERDLIRERVNDGIANARRKGVRIGRPPAIERPGFADRWAVVQRQLIDGEIGKRAAARDLGIGAGTLERLLRAEAAGPQQATESQLTQAGTPRQASPPAPAPGLVTHGTSQDGRPPACYERAFERVSSTPRRSS